MRVTLLGTGCPIVDVHRFGPATLVQTECAEAVEGTPPPGEAWLVDCGSGVTQRLLAHGITGAHITGVLLTHLHSDHTVDLIQLLISGWHQGRTSPLRIFGPRRTREFVEGLLAVWAPEFLQRSAHELRDPGGLAVDIREIGPDWQMDTMGLHIACTEVRHQPIPQAFGFRFDGTALSGGGSTVVSGDTAYCPELIALAQDCDLLVHEVFAHHSYALQREGRLPAQTANVMAYHTRGDEVGRVAREAGARNLALTHFVPVVFDRVQLGREVRADFDGGLFIGEDLMSFEVRQGQTTLLRGGGASHL